MPNSGPIIIVDDDEDDQQIIEYVFRELNTKNERKYFSTGKEVLDYLSGTSDQPFLIISDINLPIMDGPKLKEVINENEYLKKKSIPFVFLSTTAQDIVVEKAYEMMVQGFFEKPSIQDEFRTLLKLILEYWRVCIHPNSY
jgi:CheY-like chemotaxis protein